MIQRALRKLAGYTTPTPREARVAQFAEIRKCVESYALGVNTLQNIWKACKREKLR